MLVAALARGKKGGCCHVGSHARPALRSEQVGLNISISISIQHVWRVFVRLGCSSASVNSLIHIAVDVDVDGWTD